MKAEYYRIFGYTVTISMHIHNTILVRYNVPDDVKKDPKIQHMRSMQDTYFTIWNVVSVFSIVKSISLY